MSSWDEKRKESPLTCQFCGETDPTVDMWCGAPWGHAHRKCAEIAADGITLYLKRELMFRGEDYPIQYSQQRGWWCEECDLLYAFKTGSDCPVGHGKMRIVMTYHSSASSTKVIK